MIALLRAAVERGGTFFDTAEGYGRLQNEKLLGQAFEDLRDEVVIATKFGLNFDPNSGARLGGTNSRPEHIPRPSTACSPGFGRTTSTCCTSTASIRRCRSRRSPAPSIN
jgi:hypothetical protein